MADKYTELRNKWDSQNLVTIGVRLNKKADADIIEYWRSIEKKADLFRAMVREKMQEERGE